MFAEAGDRDGVASVLVTTAAVLQEQGELALAQSRYEEALVIQRNTGDMGGVAVILNNLGNVYLARGNYAVAKKMYEESVSISREIGDQDGVVLALGNLAACLRTKGTTSRRTRRYVRGVAGYLPQDGQQRQNRTSAKQHWHDTLLAG